MDQSTFGVEWRSSYRTGINLDTIRPPSISMSLMARLDALRTSLMSATHPVDRSFKGGHASKSRTFRQAMSIIACFSVASEELIYFSSRHKEHFGTTCHWCLVMVEAMLAVLRINSSQFSHLTRDFH